MYFSGLISDPSGDATTTLYLEASQTSQYPLGVLTSIVDTFINDGTTTEYMTQHVGTEIDSLYAKVATTSSREYYRIAPTASQDYNSPARPTGLIGSSTSLDIHGSESTYYTVEEYRTYLDGHYAHLVSSISNVVTGNEAIQPTPRFGLEGALNSDSMFSSYGLDPGVRIKTLGAVEAVFDEAVEEIENEIEDFVESVTGSVKKPRQIDLDDLIAVESENLEIEATPTSSTQSLPTFTVGSNGELNFPTPSVEAVEPNIKKDTIERQHRFLAVKETKSTLDTVTYVGFVDFTTTIDDTVVIFSPKNNYNTKTSNSFPSRIEPTRAFTAIGESTRAVTTPVIAIRGENINEEAVPEDREEDLGKPASGIDALKSLLASSAAQRTGTRSSTTRSRFSPSPFSSSVSPTASVPGVLASIAPELESGGDSTLMDLVSSIDSSYDVELVFKTLFTTYTYYTSYNYKVDEKDTVVVKSREETESNVVTLTNILKPTDLPAISSSCQLDSGCLFASTDILDTFSEGFIGRPNARPLEEPRSDVGRKVTTPLLDESLEVKPVVQTATTTYTYFKTLSDNSVSTITEVYTNIHTIGVPAISSDNFVLPTSTLNINLDSEISTLTSQAEGRSIFPVRRLEVSSIRNMQLQSELTTPESITTTGLDETTTAEPVNDITTTRPINEIEDEEFIISTDETTALADEFTELYLTATTESGEEINPDSVEVIPRTLYTTFTYLTTLFSDDSVLVKTNFETVTNVMTDGFIQPSIVEQSLVTFFTTFTYWTTYTVDNSTQIVSSEETLTDILPATVTANFPDSLPDNLADGLNEIITPTSPSVIEQTVFALPSTSSDSGDISESELTSTFQPNLQSSTEEDDLKTKSSDTATESIESILSFEDLDNDLTLTTTPQAEIVTEATEEIGDENIDENAIVKPSRGRGRISISRPGNTFTPVIRPLLGNRKPARFFRPSNLVVSTTVATRTRNSVKPTLIATPASSSILNTPVFESSSRILASASIFNRGASRSLTSPSFQSSGGITSSINPTSVLDRGSATFLSISLGDSTPSVVISPIRLRRPNPFRARLKELQQEKIEQIRISNDNTLNTGDGKDEEDDINSFPLLNLPSIPGGNAPIFISSQRQKITRKPGLAVESKIEIPDDIVARRERAREKIKSLFSRRQQESRRKRSAELDSQILSCLHSAVHNFSANSTEVVSREETITNILTATAILPDSIPDNLPDSLIEIITPTSSSFIALPSTSSDSENVSETEPTLTFQPNLQSGEALNVLKTKSSDTPTKSIVSISSSILSTPEVERTLDFVSNIEIPDDIASQHERATEENKVQEQSRRKRQVAFGADFGSRTSQILRRSQSYPQSYPQDNPSYPAYGQNYNSQYNPPFTAFSNTYNHDIHNNNDAIYSSSSENSKTSNTFRRQVPEETPSSSRSRSRSRSRFTESLSSSSSPPTSASTQRSRTRFRNNFRIQSTEPTTTPEPAGFSNSRFRPRGQSSDSRSINTFSSTRNQNRFSLDTRSRESVFSSNSREPSTRSRFNNPTSSRNSLFNRGKVVDYSDYDYYDYEDTDIQSSDSNIPDFKNESSILKLYKVSGDVLINK